MEVTLYRAHIGIFYAKAVRTKVSKHSFLKYEMLVPFMILIVHGYKMMHIALLVFLFHNRYRYVCQSKVKSYHAIPFNVKAASSEPTCVTILILVIFVTCKLLLMSGDIEVQPGPQLINQCESFSIMHLNICSLRKYKNALEIEADKKNMTSLLYQKHY